MRSEPEKNQIGKRLIKQQKKKEKNKNKIMFHLAAQI